MRGVTIWRKLLDVEQVQVLDVTLQEDAGAPALVISVRPTKGARGRCSQCLRRCPGDDQGGGVRRWRALDHGSTMVFVQAAAPRVTCGQHGVVVAAVPWARPGARATRAFEDQCAWLAARTAKTVVGELMRTSWRHVTAIIERVVADGLAGRDVLAGLKRIGIDEISHRKGHRYLTCVVDQDSGRLVWAAPGRNSETLQQFFDQLGPVRCEALTHVSADGAQWIRDTVTANAPQAVLGLDPFHVVGWATRELDKVRRQAWNMMRSNGSAQASSMKGSRWALLKNPGDLTPEQRGSVASDRQDQPASVQGVSAQGATPRRVPGEGPGGPGVVGRVDRLGAPIPAPRIHRAGQDVETVPAADLEHPDPLDEQRPVRGHQHAPAGADPPGLRLS